MTLKEPAMIDELEIRRLETQHQDLESAIQDERQRPLPDEAVLSSLKKQKLRIKDQLQRFEHA